VGSAGNNSDRQRWLSCARWMRYTTARPLSPIRCTSSPRVENIRLHRIVHGPHNIDITRGEFHPDLLAEFGKGRGGESLFCHKNLSNICLNASVQTSSESAHLVAHQRTQHSVVVRPTAARAISTHIIRQTIVQHWLGTHFHLLR